MLYLPNYDWALGFGIIPEVLVDQHFYNRNRFARLLTAVAAQPNLLGLGIDEDTCAMFESDGTIKILGCGTVTIIDARQITKNNREQAQGHEPIGIHNIKLHLLNYGDRYDLQNNQPI